MAKKKEIVQEYNPIIEMPIVDELKRNFILYANEINKNRAFPYIYSGLKPVGGHALWAMWANKRKYDRPYTKSAKIDGEVMSYNPHGSNYDTLCRLAQDFIYHIPYIDGHGSFGSVIGGPTCASSRYTEMRLTQFIEDVLFYNTKLLDMGLNYLEEDPEPIINTWVALLPLLFISNTSGMGFTISNNWSSGNLFEFREQLKYYLKTGKVDCSKIYPDFPTGGIIINKSEMKNLYETGSGTIKLRGKTEIKGNTIRILSLPYQTYPEQFMEDLKKYLTSSQHTITDVANRCDKNGFLIEIECEKDTAEYTLEVLFKKTCLQTSISDEHKAVLPDGKVITFTFLDYMKSFVDSNIELVKKEAQLNLDEILARLEIVNGLLSALDIIDKIIAEIKKSKSQDEAKKTLVSKFKFTENQAQAIVQMTLGRLANLEKIKLQDEKKDLDKRKADNEDLLNNYKSQEKYFLNRFNKLVDKYGWERKTELADISQEEIKVKTDKPASMRQKKEFMIVLTDSNTLKKIEILKYKKNSADEKSVKLQQGDKITLISNRGIMYKLGINKIEKCLPNAAGDEISSLVSLEDNEKIIQIYGGDIIQPYIFFITKHGYGKKCEVNSTLNISKNSGAVIMKLKKDDDELISCKLVDDNNYIDIITDKGKKTIAVKDNRVAGRTAGGAVIIKLKKNEDIQEVHST